MPRSQLRMRLPLAAVFVALVFVALVALVEAPRLVHRFRCEPSR